MAKHFARKRGVTGTLGLLKPSVHFTPNLISVACLVLGIIATIVRLAIAAQTPLIPNMSQLHDDLLIMRLANSIVAGDWLGAYNEFTLAKNPGHAFFIALGARLGISYQLMFMGVHCLACIVFVVALRDLVRLPPMRLVMYVCLLFLPVLFSFELFQRVYRMGIVIPFVILLFSGFAGLFLRYGKNPLLSVVWSTVTGVALSFLLLVKEDGQWVLPYVAVVTLLLLGRCLRDAVMRRSGARSLIGNCAVALLPLVVGFGIVGLVAQRNLVTYGVQTTCERMSSGFAEATSRMIVLDDPAADSNVWVSRASCRKALECSPTLATIEDKVFELWDTWAGSPDAELVGDYPFWALRDAYALSGGYVDGRETDEFWQRVAAELDVAFADGRLRRKQGVSLSASSRPLVWSDVATLLDLSVKSARTLLFDRQLRVSSGVGDGELADQQMAQALLLGPVNVAGSDGSMSDGQVRALKFNETMLALSNALDLPLCVLGVLSVVLTVYLAFGRGVADARYACLIELGFLLSAMVLVLGVTWFTSFLGEIRDWAVSMYAAGFYPLVAMTSLLAVGMCVQYATDAHLDTKRGTLA